MSRSCILLFLCVSLLSCAADPDRLTADELAGLLSRKPDNFYLVDVRTPQEYRSGHIPGAINIEHTEILLKPPTTDRNAQIVVYCRSGNRSSQAKRALERAGYRNVIDFGGLFNWGRDLAH